MNKKAVQTVACLGAFALMSVNIVAGVKPAEAAAMNAEQKSVVTVCDVTAGMSTFEQDMLGTTVNPEAGVAVALNQGLSSDTETEILAVAQQAMIKENEVPTVASTNADMGVAMVESYVYIRSEASADSEYTGKLYSNCVAEVTDKVTMEDGDWYQITSGNASGYVKADYLAVGDPILVKSVSRRVAVVTTSSLNVRKEASTESERLGQVAIDDDLTVIDESIDGWVAVSIEEGVGYVSTDYVTLSTQYKYAESKQEEQERLAREAAAREAARKAAAKKKAASSSSGGSYSVPAGGTGSSVASYACQFIGNPYVWGGTSLTNGADCSGFVMSVYAAFGVSLPHSSSALRSVGYGVSTSEMMPGDIVCYSGHVAIYCGNNTIVHASTPSTGIKLTSPAGYKQILAVRRIF